MRALLQQRLLERGTVTLGDLSPRLPTVLHIFPTFVVGGAQRRFAQIADGTRDRFHHVVLALDARYDAECLVGHKIQRIDGSAATGQLFARVKFYRARLLEIAPDLVITHNWGAIEWAAAAYLAGLPRLHIED